MDDISLIFWISDSSPAAPLSLALPCPLSPCGPALLLSRVPGGLHEPSPGGRPKVNPGSLASLINGWGKAASEGASRGAPTAGEKACEILMVIPFLLARPSHLWDELARPACFVPTRRQMLRCHLGSWPGARQCTGRGCRQETKQPECGSGVSKDENQRAPQQREERKETADRRQARARRLGFLGLPGHFLGQGKLGRG